jgi:oxidase EvaA
MLIKSLLAIDTVINSLDDIKHWIETRNREIRVDIERTALSSLDNWFMDETGSLRHSSGRFFSIEGIKVQTDFGFVPCWTQPIINQPEVGYLGILAKEFDGILYFLMQAKVEPGNVNCVQISPTLQATKSNYKQIHKGKQPSYLGYFSNTQTNRILLDQLQSEQGARFLRKRNRNIIIISKEHVELYDDFRWMTLGQIKALMRHDNMVNMDTRTVLSGLNVSDYISQMDNVDSCSASGKDLFLSATTNHCYFSMEKHLSWLSELKSKYDLRVESFPVKNMEDWQIKSDEIARKDDKYFKVIGVKVTISNREVHSWCQPLVKPMQQGLCAFIIKKIQGVYHFLVQAKLECGNFDVLELAPSVQCLTGNVYAANNRPPFVDYILNASPQLILYDTMQSEEGGRFYHEQNRNMLVEAGEGFPIDLPENYTWMTLGQLYQFLRFNNYLNIQARSLLAALPYSHDKQNI